MFEQYRLEIGSTWDGVALPERARAWVTVHADGRVEVDAPYHGDPAPLGAEPSGRHPRLWEHEVVEVFFADGGADADDAPYFELELGPHGHWLALAFDGYRRRRGEVEVSFRSWGVEGPDGRRWRGEARVPAAWGALPRVNAYAIHGADPRRYHAASPAPAGVYTGPDFHRLAYFARRPA